MMAWPATGNSGLGSSMDNGRKRVPREGPPTRMTALVDPDEREGLFERTASEGGWRLMVAVMEDAVVTRIGGNRRNWGNWRVLRVVMSISGLESCKGG
jgi:hypothetical protein